MQASEVQEGVAADQRGLSRQGWPLPPREARPVPCRLSAEAGGSLLNATLSNIEEAEISPSV